MPQPQTIIFLFYVILLTAIEASETLILAAISDSHTVNRELTDYRSSADPIECRPKEGEKGCDRKRKRIRLGINLVQSIETRFGDGSAVPKTVETKRLCLCCTLAWGAGFCVAAAAATAAANTAFRRLLAAWTFSAGGIAAALHHCFLICSRFIHVCACEAAPLGKIPLLHPFR